MRVSGAQYLDASGVPIALIQMPGRGSSNATERYVQNAPMAIVPEIPGHVFADDQSHSSWFEPQVAMADAPPDRGTRFISDPVEIPRPFDPSPIQQVMAELASQLADVRSMVEAPTVNLVVRPKQNVAHIGMQFERENNPQVWRTKWGWSYGVARFFRIPQLSRDFWQCKKRFEIPEAQPVASESSSGSQTEESSGSESSEPSS